jgi:HlyD family secretion protein
MKNMKHKKLLLIPVLVVVAIAFGILNHRGVAVEVMAVAAKDVEESVLEDGTVRMGDDIKIISDVSGAVADVLVTEGSFVEAGAVIAVIDSNDYENEINAHLSAIAAYEAQSREAGTTERYDKKDIQYSIQQLTVQKEELQNDLELGRQDYENGLALYESGAISKNDMDKLENAFLKAELAVNAVDVQIAALRAKLGHDYAGATAERMKALIEGEHAAISSLEKKIANCAIKAQVSGFISDLSVKQMSHVYEGQTLAVLKAQDSLTVKAQILTSYEPYLRVGDKVKIIHKLRGRDAVYAGVINEIYNFANETTSALGLKEYRVDVVIAIDDPEAALKPGYEVTAEFLIFSGKNQIAVPNAAVFEVDDVDYVFKAEGGKAVRIPVGISYKTNTETVIASGIDSGDQVIADANVEGLADGVKITF